MSYNHGVRITEVNTGTRTLTTIATAIVGLVCTASDADATAFPLNTPVLITDVSAAAGKAGSQGTLASSLDAIGQQCKPITVAVRVAPGTTAAETTTNIIGTTLSSGQRTGMQALLTAEAALGVKPRILGVPGLDTQAVTTALATVAQKLRAMAYASCDRVATVSDALDYRDNFSARELMLIHPDFTRWDTTTSAYTSANAVAYALGLRAKIDRDVGWYKTLSNVAVNGISGLNPALSWDLLDSANDVGLLNDGDITGLIRRDGFRFWGSRTCSDDQLFAFESATRTAQVLYDTIGDGLFWAIDKGLGPQHAKDILETIRAKLRQMVSNGELIGADVWYDEERNTSATLSAGGLTLGYDYTPVPPLENLNLRQHITSKYFFDFSQRLASAVA
jgi:phage tail sheath protein FI